MSGGVPWSQAEKDILRRFHTLRGPEIAKLLPGRSLQGIRDARARFDIPRERPLCSREDCEKVAHARGLCDRHYHNAMGHDSIPKDRRKRRGKGAMSPPSSLPYRALARSCTTCCEIVTTPDELLHRDVGTTPICGRCAVVKARAYRDSWYEEHPALPSRHGLQWTGPELEVAARNDLTAAIVADMLGRTLQAVEAARRRMRDDPKWIKVAGLSSDLLSTDPPHPDPVRVSGVGIRESTLVVRVGDHDGVDAVELDDV